MDTDAIILLSVVGAFILPFILGAFILPFILIGLGYIIALLFYLIVLCWAPIIYWITKLFGIKCPRWALDICYLDYNMEIYQEWQKRG